MPTVTITFDEENAVVKDLLSAIRKTGAKVKKNKESSTKERCSLKEIIERGDDDIKEGRYKAIKTEDLWK